MGIFNRNTRGGVTIDITTNAKQAASDVDELNTKYKELVEELNKGVQLQALAKSLDDAYKAGKKVITALGQIDKRTKEGKAFHELSTEDQIRVAGIYKETKDAIAEVYGAMLETIQAAEDLSKANDDLVKSTDTVNESMDELNTTATKTKDTVDKLATSTDNLNKKTDQNAEANKAVSEELPLVTRAMHLLIKNNEKLDAQQRDLRFTNSLYEGMFQSMRKIINSTKILSGAVGLLSSAFGFIIDMIFLPLLPIAVSLAEFLFGVGDAINTVLEFITGINPGIAQLISFITLATGAALLFLGGQFISGVPGISLLFEGVLKSVKDVYNNIKDLYINGVPTPDSSKKPPEKAKTPSKASTALAKVLPAATTVGAAGAGLAIGTGIVSAMQLTGAVDVLSDVGSATGIQNLMHNKALDFIPGIKQFKTTIEGAGDLTNLIQESVLGYFFPDFDVRLATTKNVVDRALKEGMYSPQVEAYLNSEFGEGAFHYAMGDESLGFERGWYNSMGDKVTSYSSAQSSSITYNNNYNNSVSNAGFNLFNIAGL